MQAIVYTQYGPPDLLQLQAVEKPIPKAHEVLVKVLAAAVNPLDCWRFKMTPLLARLLEGGPRQPKRKILGADIAGQVEAVGSKVKQLQPGDAVFGIPAGSVGAFAEYACAAEAHVALKPAQISFATAAAVPVAALTALQALRDHGRLQPGQSVLINGASGGVGTFAVQIAKFFGAEVTAVCSTQNVETAHTLGADHVIDYTQADFTQNGQRYDLIIAVNGYHPLHAYRRALRPNGRYVVIGGAIPQIFQGMLLGPLLSRVGRQKMGFMGIAKPNQKDLVFIGELLAAGKVAPIIDRHYPLRAVVEAINYVGAGHARGKVVITLEEHNNS